MYNQPTSEDKERLCFSCGKKINTNPKAKYCPSCGALVTIEKKEPTSISEVYNKIKNYNSKCTKKEEIVLDYLKQKGDYVSVAEAFKALKEKGLTFKRSKELRIILNTFTWGKEVERIHRDGVYLYKYQWNGIKNRA